MEPGDSAAERMDALAPLWAGLDVAETPQTTAPPREACVIERFYAVSAAPRPAQTAELPILESFSFAL